MKNEMFLKETFLLKGNRKNTITFLLSLALILAVCVVLSILKSGFFIDEIYTYGLSNGHFTPFLSYVKEPGTKNSIIGEIFTRKELMDYITVNNGELFDFSSVYFNQANDVHPPLYYWLINITSSFFPGVFTKWIGLSLNLILYALCLVLIYKIVLKMGASHTGGIVSMFLYGLSPIGLSTFLMIRMYILVTLLTLVLILLILNLIEHFNIKDCIFVSITILSGLLTQYYFVFYAAMLCFAYCVYLVIKKQWKNLLFFSLIAIAGVFAFVIIYPASLKHLFNNDAVNGISVTDNLFAFNQYPHRIKTFIIFTAYGLPSSIILGCILFLVILLKRKRIRLQIIKNFLIIILPAFCALIFIAIISPYIVIRYAYNLMPVFVLAVSLLIIANREKGEIKSKRIHSLSLVALALIITLGSTYKYKPEYLYREHSQYNNVIKPYSELPVVYFTGGTAAPISQDLLQLVNFNEIYVDDGNNLDKVIEYTKNSDKAIVYISNYKFDYNPRQLIKELCDYSSYKNFDLLYKFGLSEAYVISK